MVKAHKVLNSIKKCSLLKTSKLNHRTIQEENKKEKKWVFAYLNIEERGILLAHA